LEDKDKYKLQRTHGNLLMLALLVEVMQCQILIKDL